MWRWVESGIEQDGRWFKRGDIVVPYAKSINERSKDLDEIQKGKKKNSLSHLQPLLPPSTTLLPDSQQHNLPLLQLLFP